MVENNYQKLNLNGSLSEYFVSLMDSEDIEKYGYKIIENIESAEDIDFSILEEIVKQGFCDDLISFVELVNYYVKSDNKICAAEICELAIQKHGNEPGFAFFKQFYKGLIKEHKENLEKMLPNAKSDYEREELKNFINKMTLDQTKYDYFKFF